MKMHYKAIIVKRVFIRTGIIAGIYETRRCACLSEYIQVEYAINVTFQISRMAQGQMVTHLGNISFQKIKFHL